MEYRETVKFTKLFKKLCKKYKTLDDDFQKAKQFSIDLFHDKSKNFDNKGIVEIPGYLHQDIKVFKVRKFACRALKGGAMSGIRVTYVYHSSKEVIDFIEIYYKGNQVNHSNDLIEEYFRELL